VQIHKVFPLVDAYYLAHVVFCPNPKQPGANLWLANEAHGVGEYDKHVEDYKSQSWPGAVLRFTVFDETLDKRPLSSVFAPSLASNTESGLVSGSDTIVNGDVWKAPRPAPEPGSSIYRVEDESAPSESERSIFLDRIRERIRNEAMSSIRSFAPASVSEVAEDEEDEGQ
jgi:next to BRCA1 gene 1 protein